MGRLVNHRRLYEYCGDISPVELETAYYAQIHGDQPPAEFSHQKVSGLTGAIHSHFRVIDDIEIKTMTFCLRTDS